MKRKSEVSLIRRRTWVKEQIPVYESLMTLVKGSNLRDIPAPRHTHARTHARTHTTAHQT